MANQGKKIPSYGKKPEIASMLNALANKKSEQNNPRKGVVKDSEGKVKATLDPAEQARYAKIFDIAKKVMFPGPETGQLDSTIKAKSKTPMSSQIQAASKSSSSGGVGGIGGLGALAMIPLLGVLAATLAEVFEGLGMSGTMKTVHDVIKAVKAFRAVRVVGEILKPLGSVFKGLKSGMLALVKGGKALVKLFDGKAMQGLVKAYKKVVGVGTSIAKFFGGPMGTIGKAAGAIGKAVKAGGLMKMFAKVGAKMGKMLKFLPFIGSLFSFMAAYQAFKDGRYGRGVLELLSGVLNFVPGIGNIASGLLDGGMLLYDLLDESAEGGKSPMDKFGDLASKGGTFFKDMGAKILEKIKGIFGGMADWLIGKAMAAIDGVKDFLNIGESAAEKKLKAAQQETFKHGNRGADDDAIKAIKDRDPAAFAAAQGAGVAEFQAYLKTQGFKKIDDGLVYQNGVSTRIDSNDQVLAMKDGGPIDKAFGIRNALFEDCNKLNKMQVTLQQGMLAKLEEIARNTSGGGSSSQPSDDTLNEFTNLLPV